MAQNLRDNCFRSKTCRFWQTGRCTKADECTFLHAFVPRGKEKKASLRTRPCSFFNHGRGFCKFSTRCTFLHDFQPHSDTPTLYEDAVLALSKVVGEHLASPVLPPPSALKESYEPGRLSLQLQSDCPPNPTAAVARAAPMTPRAPLVYLSFDQEQLNFVRAFHETLTELGVTVRFEQKSLPAQGFLLQKCALVIAFLSPQFENNSLCKTELVTACKLGSPVVVIGAHSAWNPYQQRSWATDLIRVCQLEVIDFGPHLKRAIDSVLPTPPVFAMPPFHRLRSIISHRCLVEVASELKDESFPIRPEWADKPRHFAIPASEFSELKLDSYL